MGEDHGPFHSRGGILQIKSDAHRHLYVLARYPLTFLHPTQLPSSHSESPIENDIRTQPLLSALLEILCCWMERQGGECTDCDGDEEEKGEEEEEWRGETFVEG